ncbi:MAG: SAM-dependent chlorinase/fluorinase [Bacteroidales bacterium]|nr:SAM-dependent chlorinase/fluorinase [Bacteroidales bacterium]
MTIITLTSDWGLKDHYVGSVKGRILSYLPTATIIDLSHDIPHFDYYHTAFLIRNAYVNFPKGTIHIIAVDSEASVKTPHIAVLYDGHYFICSDNGTMSLIMDKEPECIIEIEIIQDSDYFSFPARDVFAKAAYILDDSKDIHKLGKVKKSLNTLKHLNPVVKDDIIKGNVIYIDTYENVITNINKDYIKENIKGKNLNVVLPDEEMIPLSKSYKDVEEGEILAFFNTSGFLEIAINKGNAAGLYGIKPGDIIKVEIK